MEVDADKALLEREKLRDSIAEWKGMLAVLSALLKKLQSSQGA